MTSFGKCIRQLATALFPTATDGCKTQMTDVMFKYCLNMDGRWSQLGSEYKNLKERENELLAVANIISQSYPDETSICIRSNCSIIAGVSITNEWVLNALHVLIGLKGEKYKPHQTIREMCPQFLQPVIKVPEPPVIVPASSLTPLSTLFANTVEVFSTLASRDSIYNSVSKQLLDILFLQESERREGRGQISGREIVRLLSLGQRLLPSDIRGIELVDFLHGVSVGQNPNTVNRSNVSFLELFWAAFLSHVVSVVSFVTSGESDVPKGSESRALLASCLYEGLCDKRSSTKRMKQQHKVEESATILRRLRGHLAPGDIRRILLDESMIELGRALDSIPKRLFLFSESYTSPGGDVSVDVNALQPKYLREMTEMIGGVWDDVFRTDRVVVAAPSQDEVDAELLQSAVRAQERRRSLDRENEELAELRRQTLALSELEAAHDEQGNGFLSVDELIERRRAVADEERGFVRGKGFQDGVVATEEVVSSEVAKLAQELVGRYDSLIAKAHEREARAKRELDLLHNKGEQQGLTRVIVAPLDEPTKEVEAKTENEPVVLDTKELDAQGGSENDDTKLLGNPVVLEPSMTESSADDEKHEEERQLVMEGDKDKDGGGVEGGVSTKANNNEKIIEPSDTTRHHKREEKVPCDTTADNDAEKDQETDEIVIFEPGQHTYDLAREIMTTVVHSVYKVTSVIYIGYLLAPKGPETSLKVESLISRYATIQNVVFMRSRAVLELVVSGQFNEFSLRSVGTQDGVCYSKFITVSPATPQRGLSLELPSPFSSAPNISFKVGEIADSSLGDDETQYNYGGILANTFKILHSLNTLKASLVSVRSHSAAGVKGIYCRETLHGWGVGTGAVGVTFEGRDDEQYKRVMGQLLNKYEVIIKMRHRMEAAVSAFLSFLQLELGDAWQQMAEQTGDAIASASIGKLRKALRKFYLDVQSCMMLQVDENPVLDCFAELMRDVEEFIPCMDEWVDVLLATDRVIQEGVDVGDVVGEEEVEEEEEGETREKASDTHETRVREHVERLAKLSRRATDLSSSLTCIHSKFMKGLATFNSRVAGMAVLSKWTRLRHLEQLMGKWPKR